jgi:F-type H+-transporting ATPase subunit b
MDINFGILTINLYNVLFTAINLLILFIFLKKFLFGPVTSIMEKRTAAIKSSIDEAESRNNEAEQLRKEYLDAISDAEVKAASIIMQAKQRALEEHDKQIRETKEEIAKMIEDANKAIELERKKSLENIQSEVAGIAMALAAKVLQKNVDESANKKLIDDFFAEAGAGK